MRKNRYLVAKYIPNLARMEPKNIGVFLSFEGRVSARFIGEKNRNLDLRMVRSVVSHTGSYKQWIEYWRYLLDQNRSNPDDVFDQIVASSNGNYVVSEGDSIFVPKEASADSVAMLEYFFRLLVSEFPEQKESFEQVSLSVRCEEIIKRYGLKKTAFFEEGPIVELEFEGIRQHVKPSYRWLNGHEIYFQKVSLDAAKLEYTQKDVNSAAWIFQSLKKADESRIAKALVKFSDSSVQAVHGGIDPKEYVELLRRVSDEVIDVDNEGQVDSAFAPLAVAH